MYDVCECSVPILSWWWRLHFGAGVSAILVSSPFSFFISFSVEVTSYFLHLDI
jgi:hypothetical protein